MSQLQEMDNGQAIHCLEVLHAVQTDSRTSGWYWGDVRGKAAVGAATGALWRKDLICSTVGASPFRLTPKGETFLKTHGKAWEAFLTNTDRPATVEHFARALTQMPEVHPAQDALASRKAVPSTVPRSDGTGVKAMHTEHTEQQSLHISQEKLLAFVRTMMGENKGREDDDHPLPPGPWDPVIRAALERINVFGPHPEPWKVFGPGVPWRTMEPVFGPRPEPWKIAFANILARHPEVWGAVGGGHSFGEEVALNPQPLPPHFAFLVAIARTVISRAELLQEIADATAREGEQQGIIIVGGYTSRFSDDFCGTGFRLKYPFPGPRPHWFTHELDGIDLLVMATQFERAATESFSPNLRRSLADASTKFVEAGLAKMQ